jgi:hypothetical protein
MSEILQEIWRALPALRLLFSHAREGGHPYNFGHTRSCRRVSIRKETKMDPRLITSGMTAKEKFPLHDGGHVNPCCHTCVSVAGIDLPFGHTRSCRRVSIRKETKMDSR